MLSNETKVSMQDASFKRAVLSNNVGTVVEWYSYSLYGLLAPYIGHLFFPQTGDEFANIMKGLLVFTAGYMVRPFSGLIFGYIGDVFGRKQAIIISTYMMALPTAIIGLVPTYETIGYSATIIIFLCRIVQGFSVSGELLATMVFLGESAEPHNRVGVSSRASASLVIGSALGSVTVWFIASTLSPDDLQSWGWRIPFICSVLSMFVGSHLKKNISDPAVFREIKKARNTNTMPALEIVRNHKIACLYVVGVTTAIPVIFYIIAIFLPSYFKALGMPQSEIYKITTINFIVISALIPIAGIICDKLGWIRVSSIAASILGFSSYFIFQYMEYSLQHNILLGIIVSTLLISVGVAFLLAVLPISLVSLFPINIRLTGAATSYNAVVSMLGSPAPIVATLLAQHYGLWSVSIIPIIVCLLMTFSFAIGKKSQFKY